MNRRACAGWVLALVAAWPLCALVAGEDMTARYQRLGAGPFAADAGARAWGQQHRPEGADGPRSCATCHGTDLTQAGRHAKTGKPIEPMARSVAPQRLTDPAKVEKWFGRNCRWTLGRDCTPQEKGDFIALIQSR
jgi:hypothetical protein